MFLLLNGVVVDGVGGAGVVKAKMKSKYNYITKSSDGDQYFFSFEKRCYIVDYK